MARIYKGSTYHLQLLISKFTQPSIEDIRISFYTTRPSDSIAVSEGIVVNGNIADVEIKNTLFNGLEEGLINYIVSGIRDGVTFLEERQSNYYLKNNSTMEEEEVEPQIIVINENGEHNVILDYGVKEVNITVDVKLPSIQEEKNITLTENKEYVVTKDEGFDAVEKVNVTVDVPIPQIEEEKSVSLYAGSTGVITPSDGFDGLKKVNYTIDNGVVNVPNNIDLSNSTFEEFDGGHLNWSNKYIWNRAFYDCNKVKKIKNINANDVWGLKETFLRCVALEDVDFMEGWNVAPSSLEYTFYECSALKNIEPLRNWDVSNVNNMYLTFARCANLKNLDPINNWDTSNVKSMGGMFEECTGLQNIDSIRNWDTSNITNIQSLFMGCSNLKTIDLSNWDTSNVYNMGHCFDGCVSATDINIKNWQAKNANSGFGITYMFANCESLTGLTADNLLNSTSNVNSINYLFYRCINLQNIDSIRNWDTSNVKYMANCFDGCYSITDIDLSNWNTSNVTSMPEMFANCTALKSVRMGGDVSNVTSCSNMFKNINTNGTLYYPSQYDYSTIIAQLPSTWTAVPY